MSVFKKQEVVESFPAYVVYKREAERCGVVNIVAGDILGLDSGRGFYRTYKPGSVVSYALEYNECPIAAVERAKAKGHQLHWINGRATVLSDSPTAAEHIVKVELGMLVRFEGLVATIEPDHNNNLRFKPVKFSEDHYFVSVGKNGATIGMIGGGSYTIPWGHAWFDRVSEASSLAEVREYHRELSAAMA